uniref:LO1c n=1 Tax=Carp adomavirus TaxID=2609874 RepID=A0A6F9FCR1_9VIRU|nr:TPA_asm: LO1c [Carp adomavirus]
MKSRCTPQAQGGGLKGRILTKLRRVLDRLGLNLDSAPRTQQKSVSWKGRVTRLVPLKALKLLCKMGLAAKAKAKARVGKESLSLSLNLSLNLTLNLKINLNRRLARALRRHLAK